MADPPHILDDEGRKPGRSVMMCGSYLPTAVHQQLLLMATT